MEGSDITKESIAKFYDDWNYGRLTKKIKSEPLPESQDEPVFKIVALNHNEVVEDTGKDVLVKYYAPWCGHCKAMAPAYIKVAEALASDPNIVIAEMDATANEVDGLNIQGFPTIKFYPSNNKTPIDFSGSRDEEGFFKFLKEKCSKAVTFNWDSLNGDAGSDDAGSGDDGNEHDGEKQDL